jgi:dihydrofolate reductase
MEKCIIVAVSDNWAIGKDNKMPWHIKEDLLYFKKVTIGHPVIMGSNTYKSIGKALPNRMNIVVSHKYVSGAITVPTLKEAYSVAEKADNQCFIIGGAQLYKASINDVDTLYVTHIHTVIPDADTYFPEIDETVWEKVFLSPLAVDDESGLEYNFAIYKRK